MAKVGTVYLVGAGPGDPELLTVKAKRLVSSAKIVVFDRLVSDEILSLVPSDAEMINVGKNAGNHLIPQPEINQILVDKALGGTDVVRLQGGDCFMFGRGGEELELLYKNDILFQMVPGITSAFAAPIYAGIPITHRKFCSSVHVVTGHKQRNGALIFDFDSLVRMNGTLIFLMSVSTVSQVAGGLLSAGMAADMPCAVIENGTRPNQRSFHTDISHIESVIAENKVQSPATIIVGKVCSFAKDFGWFENLPLFGKKILVTRPKAQSAEFTQKLKNLGADVINLPAIKTEAIEFSLEQAEAATCLIFTSAAGIEAFFENLRLKKRSFAPFLCKKIAVLGQKSALILEKYGYFNAFIPSTASGEALAQELISSGFITKTDILALLRAEQSSPELPQILAENGTNFTESPVYRTLYEHSAISEGKLANLYCATFTSASCVESFAQSVPEATDFSNITAVCIGSQTAKKAKEYFQNIIISPLPSTESIIETILEMQVQGR